MSLRKIQDVKVTKLPDAHDDEKMEHPAFAQIGANRMTGSESYLYGSDFAHRNTIRIAIHESTLYRGLHSDRHHEGRCLAEVELSEAQWATFVSSLNAGQGVPCTLLARETDHLVPELPAPRDRVEQFQGELNQQLGEAVKYVEEMVDKVEKMGLPQKKTREITDALKRSVQMMKSNVPFTARCFGEFMEDTVEKAKIEVNAYATAAVQRVGLDAIAGGSAALPIEFQPAKPPEKQD